MSKTYGEILTEEINKRCVVHELGSERQRIELVPPCNSFVEAADQAARALVLTFVKEVEEEAAASEMVLRGLSREPGMFNLYIEAACVSQIFKRHAAKLKEGK